MREREHEHEHEHEHEQAPPQSGQHQHQTSRGELVSVAGWTGDGMSLGSAGGLPGRGAVGAA